MRKLAGHSPVIRTRTQDVRGSDANVVVALASITIVFPRKQAAPGQ